VHTLMRSLRWSCRSAMRGDIGRSSLSSPGRISFSSSLWTRSRLWLPLRGLPAHRHQCRIGFHYKHRTVLARSRDPLQPIVAPFFFSFEIFINTYASGCALG
jgi:hypothetical protein